MNSKISPTDIALTLVVKGIFLGVVLFIAMPVKHGCDKLARWAWSKGKNKFRKTVRVTITEEELSGAASEATEGK